jgi:uridine kinase
MPAGLDGHPSPIRTVDRDAVLGFVADRVCSVDRRRVLVGIDGRSASGKSTFADELAAHLGQRGREVIRSTTDSFHRPRAQRLARGTTSADGYYLDSHDLDRIATELLGPFREGAGRVLVAAFDEPTDTACEEIVDVTADAVLVFDGLFLHRPEFAAVWDVSIYLDADERCDTDWLQYLLTDLPDDVSQRAVELDRRLDAARWPRYRHGWDRYTGDVAPHRRATIVVDNNDLAHPRILEAT